MPKHAKKHNEGKCTRRLSESMQPNDTRHHNLTQFQQVLTWPYDILHACDNETPTHAHLAFGHITKCCIVGFNRRRIKSRTLAAAISDGSLGWQFRYRWCRPCNRRSLQSTTCPVSDRADTVQGHERQCNAPSANEPNARRKKLSKNNRQHNGATNSKRS